ncbi:MAG: YdcF family protein [Stellaceae bacterium]
MYVFSKLFWYVAAPGNLLALLVVLGAAALLVRWRRTGVVLVVIAAIGFLAIVFSPLPEWAMVPLDNRFPQPKLPAHITGMIVLGGALNDAITKARGQPALNGSAERIVEAAVLARRYRDARIVVSGGEGGLHTIGWNEATPTRDLLVALGVAKSRITIETKSRNTIENAEYSYAIVRPKPDQVWLLITSADHMPRAVGCFRHVGWQVVPYPVDYRTAPGVARPNFFLSDRLDMFELAVKEWIGLFAYHLLGRTPHWFPGPSV